MRRGFQSPALAEVVGRLTFAIRRARARENWALRAIIGRMATASSRPAVFRALRSSFSSRMIGATSSAPTFWTPDAAARRTSGSVRRYASVASRRLLRVSLTPSALHNLSQASTLARSARSSLESLTVRGSKRGRNRSLFSRQVLTFPPRSSGALGAASRRTTAAAAESSSSRFARNGCSRACSAVRRWRGSGWVRRVTKSVYADSTAAVPGVWIVWRVSSRRSTSPGKGLRGSKRVVECSFAPPSPERSM